MKKLLALLALLAATTVFSVEPPALEWDYPVAPDIYFEVWSSTDLTHWTLVDRTSNHYLHIEPQAHEVFYLCRAVDRITGIWSDWSNRADFGFTPLETEALDILIEATLNEHPR